MDLCTRLPRAWSATGIVPSKYYAPTSIFDYKKVHNSRYFQRRGFFAQTITPTEHYSLFGRKAHTSWTQFSNYPRFISSGSNNVKGGPPPKHFMSDAAKTGVAKTPIAMKQLDRNWESETAANLPHPVWGPDTVRAVQTKHYKPSRITDFVAYAAIKAVKFGFDIVSGYKFGHVDENTWLNRIVFLETIAGVPGLVAAMVRHLKSLRRMDRDYGWIHTLLEEAENERMHLMTALQVKQPTLLFRIYVAVSQGIFLPAFAACYLISPTFAHRFVGYLEEEAVKTYSILLEHLEKGEFPVFQKLPAPLIARQYWELADDAMFTDVIYAIRADESHHRDVNHTFASMKPGDQNPFAPGA